MATEPEPIDPAALVQHLPQRSPYLLLDSVDEWVPDERLVATGRVRPEAPYFEGHFPGDPVMPGVLQIEALAQATTLLGLASQGRLGERGGGMHLLGLDKVRFRRKVVPGDVLLIEVEVARVRGPTWRVQGRASVDGERAAEAVLLTSFSEPE